jgi:ribosome-associated protein
MVSPLSSEQLIPELEFSASRSSGAGGQNVNKVNSKVTLKWDLAHSNLTAPEQKELLRRKLSSRLTLDGVLILTAQESRSQIQNKEAVLVKLDELLKQAFQPIKIRRASKPTKASKKKRVESKRKHSEKKQWRKKF